MSRTPRGEGIRVGGGRLRVDAARAVTKLREYQLPDPTLWTLEVVRAAVLLGATALHVEADSDDVWIGWDGPPLSTGELTAIFDDLISSGGSERRGQRLLAMGVNTALALDPRFVDLYAIDAEGTQRTRYTPRLLIASADGHSDGLRSLLAESVPRPDWVLAIRRGTAVHVRRSMSLETMARALRVDVPPEVHRVLAAANALSIPIHARPRPTPSPPPLLRVALGQGSAHPHLQGHAEIVAVEHASYHARLVWSELGVMLAAEALVMGETREGRRMPISVQLDSDRLPTNAARSAVRDGEPAIDDARRDALAVAKGLAKELAVQVNEALERGDLGRHHALRAAAMAIIHAHDGTSDGWMAFVQKTPSNAWYACLLDVPLARDVLGEHRTLRELAGAKRDVIYRGDAPVRPELAPWVSGIPWAPPGDPLLLLYGEKTPNDAALTIAAAVRRAAARIQFLSHPEIDARPAMISADLAACTLPTPVQGESWVPEGALTTIEGRVILGPTTIASERFHDEQQLERAEVVVLVHRRVLHRARIPCELPLQIWISSSTLQPNAEYTDLMDRDALDRAIEAALWAGVRAAEHLASSTHGEPLPSSSHAIGPGAASADPATIEATLRAAQRLAMRLTGAANKRRADAIRALVVRPGPLRDAPVFRPWGKDPLCLAELQAAAFEKKVLGTASRQPTLTLGDRMILNLRGPDVMALSDLLSARLGEPPARRSKKARARDAEQASERGWPLEVALVSYGDELAIRGATTGAALAATFRGARAVLAHDEPDFRAAIALLPEGSPAVIHLFHAQRRIGIPHPFLDMHLPIALSIDDDALVPNPSFEDLATGQRLEGPKYDAVRWAERLALALTDHLLGASPPGLTVQDHDRGRLLITLAELLPDAPTAKDALAEQRTRLRALPLVPSLSGFQVPLERLLLAGALPFVLPEIAAKVGLLPNFEAAVLGQREATALGRFFGVSLDDRSEQALHRFVSERRKHKEAVFLQGRAQDFERSKDSVEVSGAEIAAGSARPVESRQARLIVTSKGRRVVEHVHSETGRALEVRVDVDLSLVDLEAMDLTPAGASRVKGAAKDAGRRLLAQVLADDPARIGVDPAWTSLAFAFVDELPRQRTAMRQALLDSLLDAAFIQALDGTVTSIRDALRTPGDEVFFARDLEGWIGPAEGQKPHALDRAPILAFPSEREPETERACLVRALAISVGVLRDVSKEARRLRDARKVARGGGGEARLPPHIDRRFVVSLKTIAQRSAASDTLLEVFPQGEAALLDEGSSRLVLLGPSGGEESRSYSFVPPVFIVARSPYTRELHEKEAAETVEAATRTVVAEVLRWTIDTVPSAAWTPAMRKAIRGAALLGGKVHLERISSAAIFPTTKDTFLTYDELRDQVNRFSQLWAVLGPSKHEPLDPERRVLVLADHERARLDPLLPTIDATTELSLDAQARINMARPKASDITPGAAVRASALAVRRVEMSEGELWVAPLLPGSSVPRGLMSYRDRAPLGVTKDRCRWPTFAQVDAVGLTPDRVHGAPEDDAVLNAIEKAARVASEAVLMERFAASKGPGAYAFLVTDDVSHAVFGGRDVEVRGRLEWNGVRDPEQARVQITDVHGLREARTQATAPKTLVPVMVPLTGELWVSGTSYMQIPNTQLDGLARRAYIAMLLEAAGEWQSTRSSAEARDLALAMLVQGAIGFGTGGLNGKWLSIELSFLRGAATDLKSLARASREARMIFSLRDHELGVMDDLPEGSLVLVNDESLPSRVAHTMFGDRIQSLREWTLATATVQAPPKAAPKAAPKTAAKTTAKSPKEVAAPAPMRPTEVMARRVASLARSVVSTLPPLRIEEYRRRTTALVLDKGLVVTDDPILHAVAAAPDHWPETIPLLAAEVLSVASGKAESELVTALLDALIAE